MKKGTRKIYNQGCYGISFRGAGRIPTTWGTTNLVSKSPSEWPTDLGCPASDPAKIGVHSPLEQTQLQGTGNVHSARPSSSSFWDSSITTTWKPFRKKKKINVLVKECFRVVLLKSPRPWTCDFLLPSWSVSYVISLVLATSCYMYMSVICCYMLYVSYMLYVCNMSSLGGVVRVTLYS
jgi:hypothetical protein